MKQILSEQDDVLTVINKNIHDLPFVISIPHSGLYITSQMNNSLREDVVLANTDWYLPELYSFLEELGFTIIINNINRYVIDPNRNCSETSSDKYFNSLVYTKTTFGREMYTSNLTQGEIDDRLSRFYRRYHDELKKAISEKLQHFAKVYLLDLHSFGKEIETDIILGNDNEKTMNREIFSYIQELFTKNGFKVRINSPYKGGYITQHYGEKGKECESLQIEISYSSYIDGRVFGEEELPVINEKVFKKCQTNLKKVFEELKEKE